MRSDEALRAHHARGLSDRQVARAMGGDWTPTRVRYRRRQLALPPNSTGGHSPPAARAETKRRLDAKARVLGYASHATFLRARRRVKYLQEEAGCYTARQVRVVRILKGAARALTVREITAALEVSDRTIWRTLAALEAEGAILRERVGAGKAELWALAYRRNNTGHKRRKQA